MNKMIKLLKKLDWTKLGRREQALAVATAAAVGFAVFFMLLLPTQRRIKQYESQMTTLTGEINQMATALPELRSKAEEIRQDRGNGEVAEEISMKVDDILPGGSRLSSFLEELTRLARLRRVEFVAVRPEGVEEKEAYLQLSLRIDVKSRFRQLGDYLLMLENLPRAIIVEEIVVEASVETSPYVMAHLKATTYMAKE